MISSVDGSNAISYTPQGTENKASVELVKKSSASAKTSLQKSSQDQVKNSVKSEVSDASVQPDSSSSSNIATKNNANVTYFQKKTESKDNSYDLTIPYGNKNSGDETYYSHDTSYIPTTFEELSAIVGGGAKVTKDQLKDYLRSLTSGESTASAADIAIVKNLIAQFSEASGGTGYITSLKGLKEAQDYTTITADQVTSPVDVRV